MRRRKLLLAVLLGLAAIYGALLPWRRRVGAEVARIDLETAARQKEEHRLLDLRGALTRAQEEVTRSPRDAEAHLRLAAQYHSAGRLNEAAQQAEIAVGLQPQDSAALLMLADIQQHARRYDSAVRAYKTTLARQPGNLQAGVGLSYLYMMFGWPQEADALLEPAIRLNPRNPHLKVAQALAYSQENRFTEAERLLQEARRIAPEDAALWTPLVHLYNSNHRYAQAAEVGREALMLTPRNTALLDELAQSYYYLGAEQDASQMFDRALAVSPEDVGAHYYRGLWRQRQNQPEKAIEALEFVLHRQPGFEKTRQVLGVLYMHAHRTAEGERLLAEAKRDGVKLQKRARAGYLVAGHPRSAAAHWQMAQIYSEENDRPHAVVELAQTLALEPRHAEARRLLERLQPDEAPAP